MVKTKLVAPGLLNYVNLGKVAVKDCKKAVRKALEFGRKEARRQISANFVSRTGILKRKASSMRTKDVSVKSYEITGRVHPLPRLLNIFEYGATLAHGRGTLRPRPVVQPAQAAMDRGAFKEFDEVMHGIGK